MLCAFSESPAYPLSLVGEEAQRLAELERFGLALAPGLVFTARAEEGFYRTNNLPEQLRDLFRSVNPRRLDEDALEAACERARALVAGSYLLEDFIAQAYLALKNLGVAGEIHVRRPDERPPEPGDGPRGALIALKRLWARDWDFEPTLERLDTAGSVGLEARPAYLFAGPAGAEDAALSSEASRLLERPARIWGAGGRVVGLDVK